MTDDQLIEALATRVMQWTVYAVSSHRPGARPYPHAWRWPKQGGRTRLMVYAGGGGGGGNRQWDPLAKAADAAAVAEAMALRGAPVPAPPADLTAAAAARAWGEQVLAAAIAAFE